MRPDQSAAQVARLALPFATDGAHRRIARVVPRWVAWVSRRSGAAGTEPLRFTTNPHHQMPD
jgi:hypothetical protein